MSQAAKPGQSGRKRDRRFAGERLLVVSSGLWMLIAILTGRRRGQKRGQKGQQTPRAQIAATDTSSIQPNDMQSPTLYPAASASPAPRSWLGDPRRSAVADCMLILLAAATAAVCLLDTGGVARLLLLAIAACLIPGGALLTLLPVEDELEAAALAIGLGFAIEASGAMAMVWTGWWYPFGWAILLALAACATLALDAHRNLRLIRGRRPVVGKSWGAPST